MGDELFTSATIARLKTYANQMQISVDELVNQILDSNMILMQNISEIASMLLFEHVIDIVIRQSLEGHIIYVSPATEDVLGYSPRELEHSSGFDYAHPDDLELVKQTQQEALETLQIMTIEQRVRHKQGHYLWFEAISQVIYTESGNPEYITVLRDITRRKQAEEALQQTLIETERLIAHFRKEQDHNLITQRTVSALSHDIRNPLAIISNSKEFLTQYFDKLSEEKRKQKLENIGQEIGFAVKILDEAVGQVRTHLGEHTFTPQPVNLFRLCQVSVTEVGRGRDDNHRLRFNHLTDVRMAQVDDILLSRILLNLLNNALQYSAADTPIVLELDQQGDFIVLVVTDNGMGIAPRHLPHVFKPFYRVPEVGDKRGLGLGLSVVKECAEKHGGTVELYSTVGVGTSVIVKIPFVPISQNS